MDWDLVRVFLVVARQGQMLAASHKLGLSHATIARKLTNLEKELGVLLLNRRPTGSTLTSAGARLLKIAERMEAEILRANIQTSTNTSSIPETIRVGAPDGFGNYFLARELSTLMHDYPGLVIELVPLPRSFSVSRREADIVITLDRPSQGRLIVSKLGDLSFGFYGARKYIEKYGSPKTVEALADHAIIGSIEDYWYASPPIHANRIENSSKKVFRCASIVGRFEAIKCGAGIGILSQRMAEETSGLVQVLPDVMFARTYWMTSHPEMNSSPRLKMCTSFIEQFKQQRLAAKHAR